MTAAQSTGVAVRLPTIAELVPFNAGHSAMIECGASSVWAKVKREKPVAGGISLFHFSDDLERAREIIAKEEAKKMRRRMRDALRREVGRAA